MIRVEPATPEMSEEVLPLFAGLNNPRIAPAQWRSLFHYSWPTEEATRGFVLRDEAKAVGFIGTIWSRRKDRMCNLSSWITLPEYRNQSLLLFKAVLALEDCTITCHSAAHALYPLYRKFGFRDLETKLRILLPRPAWQSAADWLGYSASSDPDFIAEHVSDGQRAILEAHRPHHCGHLLIHGKGGSCYLIHTRTKGKRFHFSHIHYISDPDVFRRNLDRIRLKLLLANGTPLIMIDARLVAGLQIPHSREVALGTPHVYRSSTLQPGEIDNLYSELILLGL